MHKDKTFFVMKRILDIVFALCFLVAFSPVYLVTMLIIWWEDKHSPFYSQIRVGQFGEEFKFYKFRSMVVNADEILKKDKSLYKQLRSGTNKVVDDPRVTKFGKFIRKYSIDEFPQFINVLKGDMSIVGPRALRPDELKLYKEKSDVNANKLKTMLKAKPGITGLWQVSGRSNIDFDTRMDLDCYYAEKRSILYDILLILKTPAAVLRSDGAY